MRGPGLRLDLDVRRVWTCPECRRQRRLPGDVSPAYCPCREGGVMMQLTSDAPLLRRAERLPPLPFLKREPPAWWANRESQRAPEVEPAGPPGTIPDLPVGSASSLPTTETESQTGGLPRETISGPRNESGPDESDADEFGGELGLSDDVP